MACLLCRRDGAFVCSFFYPPRLLQKCNSEKLPIIIPTVPARMSDREKCTACAPGVCGVLYALMVISHFPPTLQTLRADINTRTEDCSCHQTMPKRAKTGNDPGQPVSV